MPYDPNRPYLHRVHGIPAADGNSTARTFGSYDEAQRFATVNGASLLAIDVGRGPGVNVWSFQNYGRRSWKQIINTPSSFEDYEAPRCEACGRPS